MTHTQVLSFCLGFMLSFPAAFADGNGDRALLLKLNGADAISVNLTDAPQYWVQGDYLFLQTPNQLQKYDIGSVQEIVFGAGNLSSSNATASQSVMVYPSLTTDYVFVKAEGVESVRIYAADGKLMSAAMEILADGVRVDVSAFPMGVYQLSVGSQSFKFIKGVSVK